MNINIDRADWELFLAELSVTDEDLIKLSNYGEMYRHDLPKVEVRKSDVQGLGLFATGKFDGGSIIGPANIGRKITVAGRYVNHSIDPNAKMIARDRANFVQIAIRDIEVDEEITNNYRKTLKHRFEALGQSYVDDLEMVGVQVHPKKEHQRRWQG